VGAALRLTRPETEPPRLKTLLMAALVLALASCAAFPPGTGDPSGGTPAESDGDDAVVGLDEPAAESATASPPQPPPRPPRPTRAPPRGELGERRLTGLTTADTWELLGPPSDVQEESPATVWIYDHAGCRLELFFYFDLESQQQRTLALDLEAASERTGSRAFCWQALAERGRRSRPPAPEVRGGGRDAAAAASEATAGEEPEGAPAEAETDAPPPADGAAPGDRGDAASGETKPAEASGEDAE
jgi:hypothetical protein